MSWTARIYSMATAGMIAAVGVAGSATGAAQPNVSLVASGSSNGHKPSALSVAMRTTADGSNAQVTAYVAPGPAPCRADPLVTWPSKATQLLFNVGASAPRGWDRAIRVSLSKPGLYAVCAYVVSEAARTRGDGYVVASRDVV